MIDGTETGPRTVEIGNWVGKAIYTTRAGLETVLHRTEFNKPGIYCLKKSSNLKEFDEHIYIGEGENLRERIKQHFERDFDELIAFMSKDELLTKTQIKYLESIIIKAAHSAKAAEIENVQQPSIPYQHEADVSDMSYFFNNIKLILPLMGFKFLIPTTLTHNEAKKEIKSQATIFSIVPTKGKLNAKMIQTDKGFVVLKNSQANIKMAPSVNDTYKQLWQKLTKTGVLVKKGPTLVFTEDTIFSSPSAAANIVLGRQTPGPLCWINNKGETFKMFSEKNSSI